MFTREDGERYLPQAAAMLSEEALEHEARLYAERVKARIAFVNDPRFSDALRLSPCSACGGVPALDERTDFWRCPCGLLQIPSKQLRRERFLGGTWYLVDGPKEYETELGPVVV